MLQIGDMVPDITLPDASGEMVTLSSFRTDKVVLYFYPRDDTPGCTKEALVFTETAQQFRAANTTVLGVSKDTVAKHEKFREKYGLGVTLLSDAEGDVCERFGVWVEKNMYGRKYMGIERTTFLIGAEGQILQIWRNVKVPGHVEAVLAAAETR